MTSAFKENQAALSGSGRPGDQAPGRWWGLKFRHQEFEIKSFQLLTDDRSALCPSQAPKDLKEGRASKGRAVQLSRAAS